MRSTLAALAVVAAVFVGSFTARVSGSTGPIPLNCDRACLEGLIDQYLKAVVAHDPSKLPLSKDVKYSENYQMIEVGEAFDALPKPVLLHCSAGIDRTAPVAAYLAERARNAA